METAKVISGTYFNYSYSITKNEYGNYVINYEYNRNGEWEHFCEDYFGYDHNKTEEENDKAVENYARMNAMDFQSCH